MNIHATYCSANKSDAVGNIPAAERYLSSRIKRVQTIAQEAGEEFYILSGLFGLIAATHPIPWYDHLLISGEVDDLVKEVVVQLQKGNVTNVTFFTTGEQIVQPYESTISKACATCDVPTTFKHPFQSS